jgi:hypothetical protein
MNTTIELLTRIMCDTRFDGPADGAYLYCTTVDNQASVFQTARSLISHSAASRIYLLEANALSGYPGAMQCRKQLNEFGLPQEKIASIPIEGAKSLNTLIESKALIRFFKDQGLRSLVVVSPPFHQLRAFMTAVTVALKWYPALSIYSCPGATLPWLDPVAHSQGTLTAQRRQLIQEELIRIHTYQKKGDLAGFESVLSYLNRRDNGSRGVVSATADTQRPIRVHPFAPFNSRK